MFIKCILKAMFDVMKDLDFSSEMEKIECFHNKFMW